jgi:nitroimidazol reductase NimA-like FMN-containing flavoprotein (pyridoxamine 5'-phosphate oxidase superfamily)
MRNVTPVFSELTTDECRDVLLRNHVGRIAFLNGAVVDIEPVSYAAADSWIFVRSEEGAKLEALAHRPYVAFEVDEVEGPFEWRSVVAHGTVYVMSDDIPNASRREFERAVTALRSFAPSTLQQGDPTPFRRTIYGIHIDRLTGRTAKQQANEVRPSRV